MNSGVPGSPRSGGPPFQAYQYVRRVPSASFFVIEFMPLSRTRILLPPRRNPIVEIVARSVVSRDLARAGNKDRVMAGLGVERDFAAASRANSRSDAGDQSLGEGGAAARLALGGHDAPYCLRAGVIF